MAEVIIGTAGHIDHGKTTLIKRLTGIETDRLKEEKERGITIELGFAYFDLPSGKRAGIIDVPGHERFIKHMLAGVAGMDLVIMVVAADEGVMPQTKEHLDILNLLGLQQGIIAITKADTMEPELLPLVEEEIREAFAGTFLEEAPMIPLSALTGHNIPLLIQRIEEEVRLAKGRQEAAPSRLPIDRVFSLKGHGTIVTGTLLEGTIKVGDELMLYPEEDKVKIRSLQVHGTSVEEARAGQRTAVNLASIKTTDLQRGQVLAAPGSMRPTSLMDVKLKLLAHGKRKVKNFSRLRLYHETEEILCRVVLLDKDELQPGEEGFAQLRLEKTIAAKKDDLFVIRFYSPLETIGGGKIIDPSPSRHKRFDPEVLEGMIALEESSPEERLLEKLSGYQKPVSRQELAKDLSMTLDQVVELTEELGQAGQLIALEQGLLHEEVGLSLIDAVLTHLEAFHKKNPLIEGASKAELKTSFFKEWKPKAFDQFLAWAMEKAYLSVLQDRVKLANFQVQLTPKQEEVAKEILKIYQEAAYKTPTKKAFLDQASKEKKAIFDLLVAEKELIGLNNEVFYQKDLYNQIKFAIIEYIKEHGKLAISDMKDIADISRKYSVPLLEHLDQERITRRQDDHRVLITKGR